MTNGWLEFIISFHFICIIFDIFFIIFFRVLSILEIIQGFQITTGDFLANTKKNIVLVTFKPEAKN